MSTGMRPMTDNLPQLDSSGKKNPSTANSESPAASSGPPLKSLRREDLDSRAGVSPITPIPLTPSTTVDFYSRNTDSKISLAPKYTCEHKVFCASKEVHFERGLYLQILLFFIPKIHINENLLLKCREAFAYDIVLCLHHKTFS